LFVLLGLKNLHTSSFFSIGKQGYIFFLAKQQTTIITQKKQYKTQQGILWVGDRPTSFIF
jgi:hypothetical protein